MRWSDIAARQGVSDDSGSGGNVDKSRPWARSWLEGVRELVHRVDADRAWLDACEGTARKSGDGRRAQGTNSDPTSSAAMAAEGARKTWEASSAELSRELVRVDAALGALMDACPKHPQWALALRHRYVLGETDATGAAAMGYGRSQYRLFCSCGIDWLDHAGPRVRGGA